MYWKPVPGVWCHYVFFCFFSTCWIKYCQYRAVFWISSQKCLWHIKYFKAVRQYCEPFSVFVIFASHNQNKSIVRKISAEVLFKLALHLAYGWQIQLITAMQMVVIKGHSSIFIYFRYVLWALCLYDDVLHCWISWRPTIEREKNNWYYERTVLHRTQSLALCCTFFFCWQVLLHCTMSWAHGE